MAQGKITFVYFDLKGRGEVTRLVLNAAGREFEDKRFGLGSKEFEAYKPNTPYGQLPVLEMGGKRYGQSHAINKYLANELGLGGNNNLENLRIDTIIGLFEDAFTPLIKAFFEKDEAKKAEFIKAAKDNRDKINTYLEAMLKENGTGYFIGNRLTIADIYSFDIQAGTIADVLGPPADSCPLVIANVEKVRSNPGIAKYVASQKK